MPWYRYEVDDESYSVYGRTLDEAVDEIYYLHGQYPDWITETDL